MVPAANQNPKRAIGDQRLQERGVLLDFLLVTLAGRNIEGRPQNGRLAVENGEARWVDTALRRASARDPWNPGGSGPRPSGNGVPRRNTR